MLSVQSNANSSFNNSMRNNSHRHAPFQCNPLTDFSADKFDVDYRTHAETDTLSIHFTKAIPGLIANTEDIAPGIVADYSSDGRLVSLDINSVSRSTACHTDGSVPATEGKPPLNIFVSYDHEMDRLAVFLTADKDVAEEVKTRDGKISLGRCEEGKWLAIYVGTALLQHFHLLGWP